MLSEITRKTIVELEKGSRYPTGMGRVDRGECPIHAWTPERCRLCEYGHMMCCHWPMTCGEADCGH